MHDLKQKIISSEIFRDSFFELVFELGIPSDEISECLFPELNRPGGSSFKGFLHFFKDGLNKSRIIRNDMFCILHEW